VEKKPVMATERPMVRNLAGQILSIGDKVGGTTSGRYQETIVGELVQFGKGGSKVKVLVETGSRMSPGTGADPGDTLWISTERVFQVAPVERAVLFINRSDSRCGHCGKGTLTNAKRHDWVAGYGDRKKGCGAMFVMTSSDYGRGVVSDERLREIRPDLPVAEDRAASREGIR
jgi:hypothetical protein